MAIIALRERFPCGLERRPTSRESPRPRRVKYDQLSYARAVVGERGALAACCGFCPGGRKHHRHGGGPERHATWWRSADGPLRHPDRRREAGLQQLGGFLPVSRVAARQL